MTSSPSRAAGDSPGVSLYVNQTELLSRLGISDKEWRRAYPALQKHGFPPKDPLLRKWFWPEVKAFLFRRHGISTMMGAGDDVVAEQEKEDWNAA